MTVATPNMNQSASVPHEDLSSPAIAAANWPAVIAIAVTVASILIAELLPPSLLTPLARDLDISEGLAGQTITATAFSAMLASLCVTRVASGIDRRLVLLSFSALLIVSGVLTAMANGVVVLMSARVLLGVALGGFWALSASLAMRLVPEESVPRALSIIFGGVSVAMVAGAPLGTYLSALIGWRGVFLGTAGIGLVCLIWQWLVLPAMPAERETQSSGVWRIARRRGVAPAMLALFCIFAGNMAYFTYMRPFYETVTGFDVPTLSKVLLAFGIANLAGTTLAGFALKRSLTATLLLAPLVLSLLAAMLVIEGRVSLVTIAITAAWGFAFGAVPVGWSTWVTRNLGDDAENAGGLQVAVIQFANVAGALVGGVIIDGQGPYGPIVAAGILMLIAALTVALGARRPLPQETHP